MNKEEIDNLENYLKNKVPKFEPTIPVSTYGSVDLESLMNSIRELKKVPDYNDLLKENMKIKAKLEENQNIIDETIEFLKEFHNYKNNFKWCEEDYIQTILTIEKKLERGKDE